MDYNNSGSYDGDAKSDLDLDPSLPAEATDPAVCGKLVAAPSGGMHTGGGGDQGGSDTGMIVLGGLLLAGAAAGGTTSPQPCELAQKALMPVSARPMISFWIWLVPS